MKPPHAACIMMCDCALCPLLTGHEKALGKLARMLQDLETEARKLDTKWVELNARIFFACSGFLWHLLDFSGMSQAK